MNGGLWPAKCSSGWSPVTMAAGEGTSSVPPAQPRSQNVQAQMEINSLYPLRNPISQDPTFNSMNPVHGGPGSGEMRIPTLSLLSGNYPQPNYNNALQSFAFPFSSQRPISESQINEIQNRILQNSFSKGGPSLQVNVGNVQSGFRVQSLDFRAPQKVSLNGKSASKIGDQILVFCMNKVGELFVVESRYLGVICVCHKLKMSVATFCEHSGVNASKAGESVFMENGMTISQWAKYFLQVESIKWDWPNESVGPTALESNNNNNNSVFKNPGQVKNIFNGYNYNNNNNNIAVLSANPNLAAQRGQIGPDLFRGVIDRPNSVEKMVSCGNNNNWNRENNTSNSLRFDKGASCGNSTGNRENNNTSSSSLRFEKGPSFENSIGNGENNTTSSLRFEKRPSYGNNNWNRENNSSNPSSIFEKGTTNGNSSRNSENNNSSYSLPRFEIGVISGNSTGNRENNPSSSSRFEITPSYGNNTQNRENNKISSLSSAFGKVMDFGNSTANRENNNSGMGFGNSSGNRENNKSSSPSGFELKLGQPSSNTNSNSMRGVIPSYSQPCTVFDARNSHHQPFVNKDFSSRETAKPMQNPQKEDLPFPGNPSTVNSNPNLNSNSNSNSNPASDEFGPDSVKNSLISLFLSHLERKNPTESTDDAFRNNNNDSFRGLDEKSSFLDHQTKSGLYERTSSISLDSNLSFSRFCANDGGPVCNFSQNLRPCSLNVESSTSRQHGFQPVKDLHLPKKPEKLATFCEKAPQHGKMCCLSNLNNNNNNNQNALNEEISHESRCNNRMPIHHQCVVCMREQFGPCCTCANEKLPCVSNTHEILTKCGAHCISNTEKSQNNICAISSLEEEQHTFEDSSQRPNLLNPNPNLWKDVPKKDFQERVSIPEKEISSISSGSSAQAVTQASVQTGTNESVPVLADEASGVEKCGSSDEKNEFDTQIELSKSANSIKKSDSMRRKHVLACTVQNKPVKRLRNNFGVVKSFTEKRRNEKSVDLVHREPVSHSDSERFSSERGTESSDRSDSGETFTKKKRKEKSVDSVHHAPLTNKTSFGRKRKDSSVGLVHHGPTSFTDSGNETFCEKRKEEVDSVHRGPTQQGRKMPKYKYLSLIGVGERERETETGNDSNLGYKRNKPIVCGDLGIISNGLSGDLMNHNVKIVSLISVMRRTDKDRIGDKMKEIECEKPSGLVRDETDLKKNKGLVGNCSKNEGKYLKTCGDVPFSGSGESSRKIRRVRKKSMLINVTEEKEKEMDRFESSALSNTELDQAAINKAVPMNLSLSSEENQVANCLSQRNEISYNDEGQERLLAPNSSCSVCRSSNEEEFNKIIQCNQCFIKVHQACYGVSSIPKTGWFCRPCKINSFNPVCVLCGYKGGAMTRASKPHKLINSLIKHTEYENRPGLHGPHEGASCQRSTAHWVHMVCGLWTPGTRCPNVGTMGSFDVSGASLAKKNIVCSICNRAGGSCIECRVSDCSVVFHPWCAHKKGLLQNEAEGDNSEKVGFYGRCIFHAMLSNTDGENNKIVETNETESALIEELTCARTEGFKGRKREKGLSPNYGKVAKRDGIVSQEQINAWFRINGQKPFKSCISKPLSSSSDVEPDSRKEYVRYKQLKAWEKLIVYKSGIHALGLYTSCFIPRGSMVVEYVGEIVGQRVADKREREYQSIQRLHSKSACYFFRIDKNHIIDATRKGGVARFVNHSCSPNCVAKIISIKNEKKVVFFAEREINPGEEITYDYHFNREDEGEKIPCFCNSKNCRLYLN